MNYWIHDKDGNKTEEGTEEGYGREEAIGVQEVQR
jgi:hypothetical protein